MFSYPGEVSLITKRDNLTPITWVLQNLNLRRQSLSCTYGEHFLKGCGALEAIIPSQCCMKYICDVTLIGRL